jgi:hypothetical protein
VSATVFYADSAEFATLQNVFSVSGTPTDPTAVTCTVTDPAGAATVHTYQGAAPADITKAGTGTYQLAVACTLDGIWVYSWRGTGAASDVIRGTWTVGPSALNQNYCTAEELKSRLKLTGPTGDDFEIAWAVATASRGIDRYCDRYFYRGTDTRTYIPDSLYQVTTGDLVSVTTLATDPGGTAAQGGAFPVTWPAGSWQLLPYNPGDPGEPWPYTKIRAVGGLTFPWVTPLLLARMDRVQVTGVFGWPAVPAWVKQAALITAAELFRSKDLPLAGEVPGEFAGMTTDIIASSQVISRMLAPYRASPFLAA